jgi:hypothetical protein
MRMVEEMNISSIIYLIHCKNLHKCHNVPPPFTTIKEKSVSHDLHDIVMLRSSTPSLIDIFFLLKLNNGNLTIFLFLIFMKELLENIYQLKKFVYLNSTQT